IGVVSPGDVPLLAQVPGGEVEVVTREAHAALNFGEADLRIEGIGTALVVEDGEHGETAIEFALDVVYEIDGLGERNLAGGLLALIVSIVFGAPFGIGENVVGGFQQEELFGIASIGIVGVKARRKVAVHTMNRLVICVGADLEKLVVVQRLSRFEH